MKDEERPGFVPPSPPWLTGRILNGAFQGSPAGLPMRDPKPGLRRPATRNRRDCWRDLIPRKAIQKQLSYQHPLTEGGEILPGTETS
jgi:hypothetical protein